MKVAEFAKAASVTPELVRYYTRIGLLQPAREKSNGYKRFNGVDMGRLRFILRAKRLGFALDEIAHILSMARHGDTPCPTVRGSPPCRGAITRWTATTAGTAWPRRFTA